MNRLPPRSTRPDTLFPTTTLFRSTPPATGITDTDAAAFQQMGFDHLLVGFDVVGWVVFVTLVLMSIGSWYYTVVNVLSNLRVSSRADRVVRTFWETTNAQDAIHFMQEQPKTEPFSKIALDCAEAEIGRAHV